MRWERYTIADGWSLREYKMDSLTLHGNVLNHGPRGWAACWFNGDDPVTWHATAFGAMSALLRAVRERGA